MHRLMAPAGIVSMEPGASCPLQPRRVDPTIRFVIPGSSLIDSLDVPYDTFCDSNGCGHICPVILARPERHARSLHTTAMSMCCQSTVILGCILVLYHSHVCRHKIVWH